VTDRELWWPGSPIPGYCCGSAYSSTQRAEPALHHGGYPNRCSRRVPTQRGFVPVYPCAYTRHHAGDCWLHPDYRTAVPVPSSPEETPNAQ
jgi:hypothetical protein